ncbi:hypothetical protein Htur_0031 [Haloterrigena turkmenica DSM 5511]|uniref:Uncharacterized protein n=1 Tax=Haloterrigena turkmenica (strain ATCC 51198 / DSM 5511 / JCM 9101 / NCIMB 13204 / VKM B-1734 / 4k) TaxID=543526 RepID=D2RSV8_HALTV|nr:hypothetical protein [Haloterrigena turkmenica]ADB58932.1 hypothetical protein Htur_0031 [Haloterrigena turkmenica DSM 5511]
MSTDDCNQNRFDLRPAVSTVLDHPLAGLERRRTTIAVAYLSALIGLFAVSYAGANVRVDDVLLDTLSLGFDHVSTVLIVAVTATVTVVPFAYAIWNGGPGLTFAIPLVPVALGDLAAGQYVLGVDTAVALTAGAAASALALYAIDVRTADSLRPWRTAGGPAVPRLLTVTVLTVVAAFGIARFVAVVPPRSLERYAPFAALWLVPFGIVASYWTVEVRTAVATRADHADSDRADT